MDLSICWFATHRPVSPDSLEMTKTHYSKDKVYGTMYHHQHTILPFYCTVFFMTRPLKDFIHLFVQNQNDWKIKLAQEWQSTLGPLSAQVTLEKIEKDTAVLGVYDSCWMQELYLLTPLLLKTINTTLDQPHIKQLRFKKAERKQPKKEPQKKVHAPKHVTLTRTEEHALDLVDDPSLRGVLKTFLIRCYQENTKHEKTNTTVRMRNPHCTDIPDHNKRKPS